jgi:6,7-dimethyl-8-ribityllumazine synthase
LRVTSRGLGDVYKRQAGNKGFEAALTAIEMADLISKLPK